MGFFDEPESNDPSWEKLELATSPPTNMMGNVVSLRTQVARMEAFAIDLAGFVCYPSGLEFSIQVRSRDGLLGPEYLWMSGEDLRFRRDNRLHIGFEFSNGTRVSNLAGLFPLDSLPGTVPVLMPLGGRGNRWAWTDYIWLSPLPTAGIMRFFAEWEFGGLMETELKIDATPFLAAASAATELWPPGGDRNAPPAVWTSMELNELPDNDR
jgi:hypothetical protein